jgi:hypothetical protein
VPRIFLVNYARKRTSFGVIRTLSPVLHGQIVIEVREISTAGVGWELLTVYEMELPYPEVAVAFTGVVEGWLP